MKTRFIILFAAICSSTAVVAQRQCGIEAEKAAMIAKDPSWAQRFEAQRASLQGIADNYKRQQAANAAERTTNTTSPCPVIFHIIVSTAQLATLGGYTGIQQRVTSQIAVLNEDFNRGNSDSSLIPSGWKPLYGNVGIQFGLAHTAPNGSATPGYEVLVSSTPFNSGGSYSGGNADYPYAKYDSTGGLSAWDNTKYINVWCINFADNSGLLGITSPQSFIGGGPGGIPNAEIGICINFESLGKRASASDNYIATGWSTDYYDQGRTLTHEMGHFFEIWHTWGDDGGLCPWNGGSDDGLADTPPEGDAHYWNWPDTIAGGTYYDVCTYDGSTNTQPYGIASLDYLNYTDDVAMHMFTTDQAAAMASMALINPASGGSTGATGSGITGESYSLTQNPLLLQYPPGTITGVAQLEQNIDLSIFPNPTTGTITLTFNQSSSTLQSVTITNMIGQEMQHINTSGNQNNYYSIDLSGMSKGMYFVRCNFASGSITRKILLQ